MSDKRIYESYPKSHAGMYPDELYGTEEMVSSDFLPVSESEKTFRQIDVEISEDTEYVFISYSHKNRSELNEVRNFLDECGIFYWYDESLRSGEDWNLAISRRLVNASVCLLLLSVDAAASPYIKNEINFAIEHRVPIHVLRIDESELPLDLQFMLGRIQMMSKSGSWKEKLLKNLPDSLTGNRRDERKKTYSHELFQIGSEIRKQENRTYYRGYHKVLRYPCEICIIDFNNVHGYSTGGLAEEELIKQAKLAVYLKNLMIPAVYDIDTRGELVRVFTEYVPYTLLEEYMKYHVLSMDQIRTWAEELTGSLAMMQEKNLCLKNLQLSNIAVTEEGTICFMDLIHQDCGLVRTAVDNHAYYIARELEAYGGILRYMCTGESALFPLPLICIGDKPYDAAFYEKRNLEWIRLYFCLRLYQNLQ